MTILLTFQNLSIARGDRILLRALSAEIRAGEVLHIRGSNGVGKTSLLEVLCGLREAADGSLQRKLKPEEYHWVGHRNALNPALTPFENLRFWCALQGVPQDGVRGALRGFGLHAVADRPCRQLSAGQKRRAALARLAVQRRTLWFLDEPLSALDHRGVQHWLSLLREHQAQNGAALITSHQPLPEAVVGLRTWDLA